MLLNDEVDAEIMRVLVLDLGKIWEESILFGVSYLIFGFSVTCLLALISLTEEGTERTEMLLQEETLGRNGFGSKLVSKSNKLSSSSSCLQE